MVVLTRGDMIRMRKEQESITVDVVDSNDKVLELHKDGLDTKAIAQETGLSSQKVASIIRKGE